MKTKFSGCHPTLARNAKCPLRPERLLAGVPAANRGAQALPGEPPLACTGTWARKASAGQDTVPGLSLRLGYSAVARSSCRKLFIRPLAFKESVHLPGWKHLCKCLPFSAPFHLYEWGKKKKEKGVSYIDPSRRLQEICLCLREGVLCWAPICSNGPLPGTRLVSYKTKC